MPVSTLQLHVAAVQALLVAPALPSAVTVFDGDVPSTPGQTYVVLYADAAQVARSSIAVTSDVLETVVQITCVGTTARQARDVLDAVRLALVDKTPTVAGRQCWPITQVEGSPPMRRDDPTRDPTIDRPRFVFTPQFRVRSAA